ncbi:unnamed protein product, partial [Mesorhabditis belari]|uniref:C2H2-type domain-containing protein n=1 Tax=Mesorhabditis belari TaxID=2138241 RepID=A0AAF3EAY4_9BILA
MSLMAQNVMTVSNDEKIPRKRKRLDDVDVDSNSTTECNSKIDNNSTTYNSLSTATQQPNEWSSTDSHIMKEVTQSEPEKRLETYIFSAEGKINDKSEKIKLKFMCTYQKCNKILQGNVALISHLWAHIVEHTPAECGYRKQQKNFSYIQSVTCKQCLLSFVSPYRLQIHYTKCHSRITEAALNTACQICEKEVPSLLEHLALHPPMVAPYACQVKSCKYRSSQRTVLFDHYMQHHANCMYLCCPFCTYTKKLLQSQLRTKAAITCHSFVDHIAEHGRVLTRYRCSNCAYSFLSLGDMKRHWTSDHKKNVILDHQIKWTIKQLRTDAFRQREIGSIHTKGTDNRDACIVNESSALARSAKCKGITYEELILKWGKLPEENPKRSLATKERFVEFNLFKYLNKYECGFAMRDENLVVSRHLKDCDSLGLTKTKMDHSKQEDTQEDIFEAKIFAVIHPVPVIQPSLPQITTMGNNLGVLDKIRDELADIDDLGLLASEKFLMKAQFNDVSRSFRQYDEYFRSK